MAYTVKNFSSKKELKEAVKAGPVAIQEGMFGPVRDGREAFEGPHYPQPHRWYAECEVKNGMIVKVVS